MIKGFPTLLMQSKRKIGLLIPDVVMKEGHTDKLNVTTHPVEAGAPSPIMLISRLRS